jgi:hypothetical protein
MIKVGDKSFKADCELCGAEDIECFIAVTDDEREFIICKDCARCLLDILKVGIRFGKRPVPKGEC